MDGGERALILDLASVVPFDRGGGVRSLPCVGAWNSAATQLTTGVTVFAPGTAIPLHTHNVDESVLILEGRARVTLGDEVHDAQAGFATWARAGVPHSFANAGDRELRIYWVYAGREVTRTICATGETVAHLSEADRTR